MSATKSMLDAWDREDEFNALKRSVRHAATGVRGAESSVRGFDWGVANLRRDVGTLGYRCDVMDSLHDTGYGLYRRKDLKWCRTPAQRYMY